MLIDVAKTTAREPRDMSSSIKTRIVPGTWVIRAGGAVLGESASAVELSEPGCEPVIYFPRGDVAMAFLEKSDKVTTSAQMGDASYYGIVAKSGVLADAAWSYESPKEGMEAIAGHLAFDVSRVAVEEL